MKENPRPLHFSVGGLTNALWMASGNLLALRPGSELDILIVQGAQFNKSIQIRQRDKACAPVSSAMIAPRDMTPKGMEAI